MKIGFIGAGQMVQALAKGFVQSGRYEPSKIIASCPKNDIKLLEEIKKFGINTTHDNLEVAHKSEAVFIAVQPILVPKIAAEIAPVIRREHLLISVALGITLRYIENLLPAKTRVVRVMPNTPSIVSAGVSAYSMGAACQDGDSKTVEDLLKTVGYAVEVPETYMDPITGLSGSGPSYVFAMIEGLADGGVKQGLPRDLAIKLSAMTFFGAAKMVLETGEHPSILKEAVQGPGGSTIYGIHEMEKGGFRGILINTVEEATRRARATGALPKQTNKKLAGRLVENFRDVDLLNQKIQSLKRDLLLLQEEKKLVANKPSIKQEKVQLPKNNVNTVRNEKDKLFDELKKTR